MALGVEYGELTIKYSSIINVVGDIRNYPKTNIFLTLCSDPSAINYGTIDECRYLTPYTNPSLCLDQTVLGQTGVHTWISGNTPIIIENCQG